MTSRRAFLAGLGATFAAPAIVRAASLMPVKVMPSVETLEALLRRRMNEAYRLTAQMMCDELYKTAESGIEPFGNLFTADDFPILRDGMEITIGQNT